MAGGTRLHRWIYEASLGRDERSIRFRKEENEPPAVRKLSVSLDRADNVIEGGPGLASGISWTLNLRVPHSLRGWQRVRVLTSFQVSGLGNLSSVQPKSTVPATRLVHGI